MPRSMMDEAGSGFGECSASWETYDTNLDDRIIVTLFLKHLNCGAMVALGLGVTLLAFLGSWSI